MRRGSVWARGWIAAALAMMAATCLSARSASMEKLPMATRSAGRAVRLIQAPLA